VAIHVKLCFRASTSDSEVRLSEKLINTVYTDPSYQRQKCSSMTPVSSGNINYLWIFECISRTTVLKPVWGGCNQRICSFPVAIIMFVSFGNKVNIIVPYDDTPLATMRD